MSGSLFSSDLIAKMSRDDLERIILHLEPSFFFMDVALGVFHQVGNEINGIDADMLMIETLIQSPAENIDEIANYIREMRKSIRSVKNLIGRVRTRGRTLDPHLEKCLIVRDVVKPAIEYSRRRIEGTNIHLSYSLSNRDFHSTLDVEFAKDIIINILNNAIWAVKQNKHTTKKEIFVIVREGSDNSSAKIEIRDSGIGIERDNLRKLFQPFFTTRPSGTGLGLFFSRLLAEQFGGSITIAKSVPMKGTTVLITLPIKGIEERVN